MDKKIQEHLNRLTRAEKIDFLAALDAYEDKVRYNKREYIFQDTGPLRRELYPKHMEFFKATKYYPEVSFVAGNQCGKSFSGNWAGSCWVAGIYEDWWEGRVFDDPINYWAIAPSNQKIKEGLQEVLLGKSHDIGSGFIPKKYIDLDSIKCYHGTDVIESFQVYWRGNKKLKSYVTFKSALQDLLAFSTSQVHAIHVDELVSMEIYSELLARTTTTNGIIINSYTPTRGLSGHVKLFLPSGKFPPNGCGTVDYPHNRVVDV